MKARNASVWIKYILERTPSLCIFVARLGPIPIAYPVFLNGKLKSIRMSDLVRLPTVAQTLTSQFITPKSLQYYLDNWEVEVLDVLLFDRTENAIVARISYFEEFLSIDVFNKEFSDLFKEADNEDLAEIDEDVYDRRVVITFSYNRDSLLSLSGDGKIEAKPLELYSISRLLESNGNTCGIVEFNQLITVMKLDKIEDYLLLSREYDLKNVPKQFCVMKGSEIVQYLGCEIGCDVDLILINNCNNLVAWVYQRNNPTRFCSYSRFT